MKKLLSLVVVMFFTAMTFAQEVTLTVIGTGVDEEQATLQALRSAIEQTFGAFVSSNTTISNDELIKDDLVSVTNGNITEYQKISVSSMPNGQVSVSLIATVSVNKLLSYAKSTGSVAEFSGNAYAMNLKLLHLKIQSIQKAYDLMVQQLESIASEMFDFKLTLEDNPTLISGSFYDFNCNIEVVHDDASLSFNKLYRSTIRELELTRDEILLCYNENIDMVCINGYNNVLGKSTFNIEEDWKMFGFDFVLEKHGYGGNGPLHSDILDFVFRNGVLPISVEKYASYVRRLNDAIRKAFFRCLIVNISNPIDSYVYCIIANADSVLDNKDESSSSVSRSVINIVNELKYKEENIALRRIGGNHFLLNKAGELSNKSIRKRNLLTEFGSNCSKDEVVWTHREVLPLMKEEMLNFEGFFVVPMNTSTLPVVCEIGMESDQLQFFYNLLVGALSE